MIGSAIGGYVDPDVIKGPRLDRNQKQLSQEGAPRTLIYGKAAVMGNIIQCGPIVEHKKKERTGKGGPVQETYTYTRTVAVRIGEGQVLGGDMVLSRLWMNEKLVYDRTGFAGNPADSAKFASLLTFYSGSETQLPDPSLEALPAAYGGGAGNVPAYRGTCYAVLTDLDCTDFGGAVPQFKWEVSSCGDIIDGGPSYPFSWMIQAPDATGGPLMVVGTADGTDFTQTIDSVVGYYPTALANGNILIDGQQKTVDFGDNYVATGGPTLSSPSYLMDSGRVIGFAGNSVYYSDNEWATYTTVDIGESVDSMGVGGDTVIIMTEAGFKRRISNDRGATFGSEIANSQYLSSIGHDNGQWVFGGSFGYMAWSINDGIDLNYEFMVDLSGNHGSMQVLPAGGGAWITIQKAEAAATTGIIYRSEDGKTGWTSVTIPSCKTPAGLVNRGASRNGVVIVAAQTVSGTLLVLRSDDGGGNFIEIPHGLGGGIGGGAGVSVYPAAFYAGIAIPDSPGYFYDRETDTVNGPGVGTVDPCIITLDEIVADLTERGNVRHYDVTALASDVVLGYPITQPTTSAGAIKSLQEVYYFDYPEWGNSGEDTTTLRAVRRGGSAAWSLDDDDLIDADDEETRAQAVEFPRKVNLISLSPAANYNPIKQTAERESENVRAIGETTIDTAVVFERDEAARRVDILSKVMTEEALGRSEVTVPEDFTRYTTSDPGTWKGKRWRIDKIESGDGESKWFLTRDRAKSYESTAIGSTALDPTPAPSSMRGPTMFAALNLPRLRSQDSTPGMYIAVCGIMPAWEGCDLYLSTDGGVTEQKVATIIDPAVMGILTAGITDSSEPLSIDLYDGELDDATDAQLAARQNAAAVTSAGVSEILQFKEADQVDNLADLTMLTRELLTTTAASHSVNDSFVLLDGSVYFLPLDISLAGKELIFRPVTRGTVPANNVTYTVTFNPLFTGPQVVEEYTDDAGNVYTDDAGNIYYYEVPE